MLTHRAYGPNNLEIRIWPGAITSAPSLSIPSIRKLSLLWNGLVSGASSKNATVSMKRDTNDPLVGAHMSIAGGTPLAIQRALQAGCRVLQIFVKNSNRWMGKTLVDEEVEGFRKAWADSKLHQVVAHDSYLINLASPQEELWQRSIEAMLDELDRCQRLGVSLLVTHPGSHMGVGEGAGVRRIAQAIDQIHERSGRCTVPIALETTAGQGTSVGYRFEHLRDILAATRHPERVFVCGDTCHIFAAGYDIRGEAGIW